MWARSVQATPPEVVGNDDVGDGVEHHLDVSCICGAGHVTVDFLIWRAVLALELCLDVSCGVLVDVGSWRRRRREKKTGFYFTALIGPGHDLLVLTQSQRRPPAKSGLTFSQNLRTLQSSLVTEQENMFIHKLTDV